MATARSDVIFVAVDPVGATLQTYRPAGRATFGTAG